MERSPRCLTGGGMGCECTGSSDLPALCLCSRQAAPCVRPHLVDFNTSDMPWPPPSETCCHEESGAE